MWHGLSKWHRAAGALAVLACGGNAWHHWACDAWNGRESLLRALAWGLAAAASALLLMGWAWLMLGPWPEWMEEQARLYRARKS